MEIPHIAIKIRWLHVLINIYIIIVQMGYKAIISFSSILSVTCRRVQTNLHEQNGIKNCSPFNPDSFNLSNSPTASHLIYESKNKLSLCKVNDEKRGAPLPFCVFDLWGAP